VNEDESQTVDDVGDGILLISEMGQDVIVTISPKGFDITPEGWGQLLYNIVTQLTAGFAEDGGNVMTIRKEILKSFDDGRMQSYLDGEVTVTEGEH
jgi:hypothetical protein